jgi:hypothetical protein
MLNALMAPPMGATGGYGAAPGFGAGGYGAASFPGAANPMAGGLVGGLASAATGRRMGPGYGYGAPVAGGMPGQPGASMRPPPPGYEPPTPVPLPDDTADHNQGAIIAAILGGSALLGVILGCAMFRNKGEVDGDSDSDADSDDSGSEDSD